MRLFPAAACIAVLIFSLFGQARGNEDRWLAEDKLRHLMVSAFLVGHSYRLSHDGFDYPHGQALGLSCTLTALLGLGKEAYDGGTGRGTASLKDLAVNGLGIGLGLLLFTNY